MIVKQLLRFHRIAQNLKTVLYIYTHFFFLFKDVLLFFFFFFSKRLKWKCSGNAVSVSLPWGVSIETSGCEQLTLVTIIEQFAQNTASTVQPIITIKVSLCFYWLFLNTLFLNYFVLLCLRLAVTSPHLQSTRKNQTCLLLFQYESFQPCDWLQWSCSHYVFNVYYIDCFPPLYFISRSQKEFGFITIHVCVDVALVLSINKILKRIDHKKISEIKEIDKICV